jgi:hypothetical protein
VVDNTPEASHKQLGVAIAGQVYEKYRSLLEGKAFTASMEWTP